MRCVQASNWTKIIYAILKISQGYTSCSILNGGSGLLGKRTFMQMSPRCILFFNFKSKVVGLHFSSWPSGFQGFTIITNWFSFVVDSVILLFSFTGDSWSRDFWVLYKFSIYKLNSQWGMCAIKSISFQLRVVPSQAKI